MNYSQDSRPVMHMLLEGNPRLVSLLNRYVPAVLLSYFGLIVLANSLQFSVLPSWFRIWSTPIDLAREILPIFNNIESRLAAIKLSERIGLIHHLLLVGWMIFAVAFIYCTFAVLRMPRAKWIWVARARSVAKFAMVSAGMFLLFAISIFYVSIGITPTGNTLYDWYRYDLPLLWIAGAFCIALATWVGALTTFIAAIFACSSRKPGDPTAAS